MRPLANHETVARLQVAELAGLWRRELLIDIDGSTDAESEVQWLQGASAFVDLRQPARRPDFSAVRCEDDLSPAHREWLKHQAGFAGTLAANGDFFEWRRSIDLHLPHSSPDAGTLTFEGDLLIEKGWYESYVEHWCAQPATGGPNWSMHLQAESGAKALLIRVGSRFGWARQSGPPSTVSSIGSGPRGEEQQLSVEIALGSVSAGAVRGRSRKAAPSARRSSVAPKLRWLIENSSIAYRIGTELMPAFAEPAEGESAEGQPAAGQPGAGQLEGGQLGAGRMSTQDLSVTGQPVALEWNVVATEGEPAL